MKRFRFSIIGFALLLASMFLPFVQGCDGDIEYPYQDAFKPLINLEWGEILQEIFGMNWPYLIAFLFLTCIFIYRLTNKNTKVLIFCTVILSLLVLHFHIAWGVIFGEQIFGKNILGIKNFTLMIAGMILPILFIIQMFKRKQSVFLRLSFTQFFTGLTLILWWFSGVPAILARRVLYGYWVAVAASVIICLDGYLQFKRE